MELSITQNLTQKLKIKENQSILLVNTPNDYLALLDLPSGATITNEISDEHDIVQLFIKTQADLENIIGDIKPRVNIDGVLWSTYPKQSAKMEGVDINRDSLWKILDKHGLRPVRQISIDNIWSALWFKPNN